jgi:hypothetical protein
VDSLAGFLAAAPVVVLVDALVPLEEPALSEVQAVPVVAALVRAFAVALLVVAFSPALAASAVEHVAVLDGAQALLLGGSVRVDSVLAWALHPASAGLEP